MNYFEHNARTQTSFDMRIGQWADAQLCTHPEPGTDPMPRLAQQTRLSQAKLMNELVVFWGHERPEDVLGRMDAAVITRSSLHVS